MPPSLVLRPRRRRLALVIPVVAAGPGLATIGLITNSPGVTVAGGWLISAWAHALFLERRGRLEVWPDGLTTQLVGRPTEVCWERVERLVLVPTLFGRHLAADEYGGHRTVLAAPRAGLFFDGREFHDEVERIRMMPGGNRTPPPVFTSPALTTSTRLIQLAVVVAIAITTALIFGL